jgi:hypothetical protein
MRKETDPDPHLLLIDLDLGGPRTCGSCGSGSGSPTLVARYLVHDVLELHNGNANEPVVPAEAVVLHPDVELIGRHLVLVSDDAKRAKKMVLSI